MIVQPWRCEATISILPQLRRYGLTIFSLLIVRDKNRKSNAAPIQRRFTMTAIHDTLVVFHYSQLPHAPRVKKHAS